MTRHSKNCTAHTVYTYHERRNDAKRSGFGTQEVRLGKDSVRGLDCCCLTLQPAKDPVITTDGYLYDRAAILEYIITQKAELQRKLKLFEKQKAQEQAEEQMRIKAEKAEEARRFLSMNTLDTHAKALAQAAEAEALACLSNGKTKSAEKPACFWAPDPTATNMKIEKPSLTKPDMIVRCPMSNKPIRYKDLIGVTFTSFEEDADVMGATSSKSQTNRDVRYCCAVSKDPLTNATRCVVLKTSGCVVTKETVDTVIKKEMIDPTNGKKMKPDDFIEIQKGSLGFADEDTVLTAKRIRPCLYIFYHTMLLELLANCRLPVFVIHPTQVDILNSPQSFHQMLLENIRRAKRRIVLSTLYIGTGSLEMELVNSLEEAVRERKLQLTILMDATRGTRPVHVTRHHSGISDLGLSNDSSTSILGRSVTSSCDLLSHLTVLDGVSVMLYREPALQRFIHNFLPSRWNEIFGLQHIKSYVFDDSVILSGANLSHEYFTSRQDRAWHFKEVPALADFYSRLIHLIGDFCYQLKPDGSLASRFSSSIASSTNVATFRKQFRSSLINFFHSEAAKHAWTNIRHSSHDHLTLLIPFIQCGSYNIRDEEQFTLDLFNVLSKTSDHSHRLSLASGYFNLTDSYQHSLHRLVASNPKTDVQVLCAGPSANGFLHSKGLSGYIPMAYREALLKFLHGLKGTKSPNNHRTQVMEYARPGWTFHAKGLWVEETSLDKSRSSILSLIGSSNFSYRSLNRDLENQLVLYTNDHDLKTRISDEKSFIFSPIHSHPITIRTILSQPHLRLPWYARFLLPFFRLFM